VLSYLKGSSAANGTTHGEIVVPKFLPGESVREDR